MVAVIYSDNPEVIFALEQLIANCFVCVNLTNAIAVLTHIRCIPYYVGYFVFALFLLPFLIVAVFDALRVFALLNRGHLTAGLVFVLGLGPIVNDAYTAQAAGKHQLSKKSCVTDDKLAASIVARVSIIIANVLVIVVTWLRSWRHVNQTAALGIRSISGVLLRDGSIYFLAVLIVQLAQVGLAFIPSYVKFSNVMNVFIQNMPNILMSRLIMNLRQANDAPNGSSAEISRFSQFAPNFRVPTSTGIIGPIGETLEYGNESLWDDHLDELSTNREEVETPLDEDVAMNSLPPERLSGTDLTYFMASDALRTINQITHISMAFRVLGGMYYFKIGDVRLRCITTTACADAFHPAVMDIHRQAKKLEEQAIRPPLGCTPIPPAPTSPVAEATRTSVHARAEEPPNGPISYHELQIGTPEVKSDGIPDSVIVAEFQANLIYNYADIAVLTLAGYEYFIGFKHEYDFLWQRKWTAVTWLFLANRYLLLFDVIAQNVPFSSWRWCAQSKDTSCSHYPLMATIAVISYLPLIISAVFSALRVFALADRNFFITGVVLILALVPFGTNVYALSTSTYGYVITPVLGATCNPQPNISIAINFDVSYYLVQDISPGKGGRVPWAVERSRDPSSRRFTGSIYFIALVLLSVAELLVEIVPSLQKLNPVGMVAEVLQSVLVSRFIIDLRRDNGTSTGVSTSTRDAAQSLPNFRVPGSTVDSIVGPIGQPLEYNSRADWEDEETSESNEISENSENQENKEISVQIVSSGQALQV
ncbi:hypothetical protein NM688_g6191 [Phlebia brevispora]|uniref:Uncharacterized protein n=1 Tax=Phlebia brevispora TaxID=194682 RepID=A0ACC1SIP5_9APHY|nr:hypothetical protein NM688_g6191 [Phlebia brevispora]